MKTDDKIEKINDLVGKLEKEVNKICTGPNCKSKKAVKKSKIENSKLEVEQQVNA